MGRQGRTVEEKGLLGAAGEYLVASQLSLRGYVVNFTPRNYPAVDIIAYNHRSGKNISVQVKAAASGGPQSWVIGRWTSVQKLEKAQYHFIFVWFNQDYSAEFYIAKSAQIFTFLEDEIKTKWAHLSRDKQVWAIEKKDLQSNKDRWDLIESE